MRKEQRVLANEVEKRVPVGRRDRVLLLDLGASENLAHLVDLPRRYEEQVKRRSGGHGVTGNRGGEPVLSPRTALRTGVSKPPPKRPCEEAVPDSFPGGEPHERREGKARGTARVGGRSGSGRGVCRLNRMNPHHPRRQVQGAVPGCRSS